MNEPTVAIRLACTELPGIRFETDRELREPVYLGIQKGRDVEDATPADSREVVFTPTFRVKKTSAGAPNFLGPYAHGSPRQRFIYLVWGVRLPDGGLEMFRRAKIHLSHLSWSTVEQAMARRKPISATLRLTDAKGGPLCASVKPPNVAWQGAAGHDAEDRSTSRE